MRDTLTLLLIQKMLKILMMLYHLKKLENGNYEIGIHIADVSYYLEEGSILDERIKELSIVSSLSPLFVLILPTTKEKYTFQLLK
jgi:ribonuclease R